MEFHKKSLSLGQESGETCDPRIPWINDDDSAKSHERRKALLEAAARFMICSKIPSRDPFFRHIGKLPDHLRERLVDLKSDDIKDDNWHLRNGDLGL